MLKAGHGTKAGLIITAINRKSKKALFTTKEIAQATEVDRNVVCLRFTILRRGKYIKIAGRALDRSFVYRRMKKIPYYMPV